MLGMFVASSLGVSTIGNGLADPVFGIWIGLALAVVTAFMAKGPAGIYQTRWSDLFWGVAAGAVLRLSQGIGDLALSVSFPTLASIGIGADVPAASVSLLKLGIVGPVVEEAFFRGLVVVSLFVWLRGSLGPLVSGVVAALVSGGLFVSLHALLGVGDVRDALQLLAVGLMCSLLLLLSGRLAASIYAHVTYNCSFLVLASMGTLLQ